MENGKKPRLLVTGSTFPRWKDDTEPRFVLDLSLALREYFDVTVLVPAAPGAQEREDWDGLTVQRYHYFPVHKWETLCYPGAIVPRIKEKKPRALLVPFLVLSLWWNILRLRKRFDVVHSHWIIPQGIVQSCFSLPYLVTGHGGDVSSLNKGALRTLKTKCLNKAGAVTVVSSHLEKEVRQLTSNSNMHVISMGCDTDAFGQQYREAEFFGQEGKKVVLFVGRLAEKKGITYLIDAAKQTQDALLIIVGTGPLEASLKKQAASCERIRFLGAKTHEELKTIYASADIFAGPSVVAKDGDIDGLPTVYLEAMASGLPVIATRIGGIPDLVKDGENGLLVQPNDVQSLSAAIRQAFADPALLAKIKQGALQTAPKYSYKQLGKQYSELLLGLCK